MCNSAGLKITCSHLYFFVWGVRAVLSLWGSEEFGTGTKIQPFFYLCNLLLLYSLAVLVPLPNPSEGNNDERTFLFCILNTDNIGLI